MADVNSHSSSNISKVYEAQGNFRSLVSFIAGSYRFTASPDTLRKIKMGYQEIQTPNSASGLPRLVYVSSQCVEHLVQLREELQHGHSIIIFWEKSFFESPQKIKRLLKSYQYTEVGVAYALPNWQQTSHIVSADGSAVKHFYQYRQYSFAPNSLINIIKKLAYKLNLVHFKERTLVCWGKVS